MSKQTVGRVPITQAGPLLDPYEKDPAAVIEKAEDFTISINYISSQLFRRYKSEYKAGEFDNDYFVLMSQMGIGDVEKPSLKVQFLCTNNEMTEDKETIWGENVAIVEDFLKNIGKHQDSERIYLSFSSFCQGLGDSRFDEVRGALKEVITYVGAAFPSLVPFTSFGRAALAGVNNLVNKLLEPRMQSEVKRTEFAFYPTARDEADRIGEAPLQTGAFAFFFAPVELEGHWMDQRGYIVTQTGEETTPYIVVNIKKGIHLAAGQVEQNLAAAVLETYGTLAGYPLQSKNGSSDYFQSLQKLGKSIRLASKVERYFDLRSKGTSLSQAEANQLQKLAMSLEDMLGEHFPVDVLNP
jgi:hypothetical protein